MQESVVQNAGALLTRASDDIDLHFIQKPAAFDNFKQSFRCELCICEGCCLDDIFVFKRDFFSDGDMGFEGEAGVQYEQSDGEDDVPALSHPAMK